MTLKRMRFVRIFAGVYCRGATNQSWAARLGYYSHYATSSLSLRYLEMCGHLEYVLLWKFL